MQKILLAIHGGASADGAAHLARLLRDRTGAALDVVAVLEPPPVLDYGYGPVYIPDAATEDALEEELRTEVRQQLARCGLAGASLSILRGAGESSIASTAAVRGADLIVAGIGAHHLTDRALGGEMALHLAQHAATPVLAVPARMRALPHRVLAAVDFSATSLAAVQLLLSLLGGGERLELVHVAAAARVGDVVLGPAHARDATRSLEELAASLAVPPRTRTIPTVCTGDPARTLLDVGAHTGAELIALGSHGYSAWQRLLVGSVSSRVLRLAPCAVLVYPARAVPGAESGPDTLPTPEQRVSLA